jgi:asparagine synthase (glutamine-hydrolysing)
MSFIYGMINFNQKPVTVKEIDSLAAAVKWDGFHEHNIIAENYALGYSHHPERKSKAGVFEYENILVLADIRIYNPADLQEQFSFDSAKEAFAKAYLKWGIDCANYINGDFAAVVIDKSKNEVHLFRDHIGARPLTYWFAENRLIFSSHEFGLTQSKLINTNISEEKLIIDFFDNNQNYVQTSFDNILKVKPGYCLTVSANQKKYIKYWKPENIKKNENLSIDQAALQLRRLLQKATTNRIESQKTGVHVSGGIDSTGVACILADCIKDKSQLIGYSWTPERLEGDFQGVNEKEFIETFASEKKIAVKYLELAKNEWSKNFNIPEFERMPIEHPTMQMAGRDQVTTLFSGYGGDEFVSLSNRGTYNHLFFSLQWKKLSRLILKSGIRKNIMLFRREVLPLMIPFGLIPTYGPKDWSIIHSIKFRFICKHWKKIFFNPQKNFFGYGNRNKFMLNLLHNYHIPERMDSWSLHSERYGFEYKYPLLDKAVLEFWFSLPIEYTYCDMQSRFLYREAMKGILTEKIRVRRDKGEGMRISYTIQKQTEEVLFIQNLLLSIEDKEHLSFFRPNVLKKTFKEIKIEHIHKLGFTIPKYLRYVALTKKYIS